MSDADRFLRRLRRPFRRFPAQRAAASIVRFAEILDAVPGLARANNLALLNAAASCLERGRVVRGGRDVSRHEPDRRDARQRRRVRRDRQLVARRRQPRAARRATSRGSASPDAPSSSKATRSRRSAPARSPAAAVGVYYYDNGHEYEQQLDGMRLIEPYLAVSRARDRRRHRLGARRAGGRRLPAPSSRARRSCFRVDGKDRGAPRLVGGHARPPLGLTAADGAERRDLALLGEPRERLRLDLAHALARDAQLAADLLERLRLLRRRRARSGA